MTLDTMPGPLCCMAAPLAARGMKLPLPALNDEEGPRLPELLPPVVDAHVHLFPDPMFEAIWKWFDTYGWPVRYKLKTPQTLEFLFSRGVTRVVALLYSHKPGMARALNQYMAQVAAQDARGHGVGDGAVAHLARGRPHDGREDADEGRLPRAVRPEETRHRAGLERIVAAIAIGHVAPGLAYQDEARRHVPGFEVAFPIAIEPAGGDPGQIERGGAEAAQPGGLGPRGGFGVLQFYRRALERALGHPAAVVAHQVHGQRAARQQHEPALGIAHRNQESA